MLVGTRDNVLMHTDTKYMYTLFHSPSRNADSPSQSNPRVHNSRPCYVRVLPCDEGGAAPRRERWREGGTEGDGLLRYCMSAALQRRAEKERNFSAAAAEAAWILPSFVRPALSEWSGRERERWRMVQVVGGEEGVCDAPRTDGRTRRRNAAWVLHFHIGERE